MARFFFANPNNDTPPRAPDYPASQESRRNERVLMPSERNSNSNSSIKASGRRNKRDLEDRIVLASRRAAARANDDFNVDDGDEDAWVHDGVDDIHIDPETRRAASELASDTERQLDAEYDPSEPAEGRVLNRTRITTIAEVIPMRAPSTSADEGQDEDSTRRSLRVLPAPQTSQRGGAQAPPASLGRLVMPGSSLVSLDQQAQYALLDGVGAPQQAPSVLFGDQQVMPSFGRHLVAAYI